MYGDWEYDLGVMIAILIVALILIIPYWKIFQKAGFSKWLALLMIVPFVNLITLYCVAFIKWPALESQNPEASFVDKFRANWRITR